MKNKILGNLSLSIIACAVLAGCGSDDKDELPTVSVAAAVSLKESRTTTIAATAADDDDTITYSWTQVSGPTLTLTNTTAATVGLTAPAVDADGAAVLRVTVTDEGDQTASADVTVNVANNVLPTVTAAFEAAAEKSDVTLTAVAADSDGEITSYSWTQTAGTPVTLTGADTATLSFTAPSVTEDTELTFSLSVTDDDEEAAAVSGIVTVTPVMTTFTVSGTVSGASFANAQVSGIVAGNTFTTTAGADGSFSLPLQADDDESNLFANITASSVTTPGLEFYKFVPSLTADTQVVVAPSAVSKLSTALTNLFRASPMAEGDSSNAIAINAVSTALYSLIIAANGGTAPADLDSFTFVEKSVSPDDLIEAAAVVQLVAQGGDFALPEGVTNVLELLTNVEAYNDYVAAAEATTPGIIATTIDDIIADPELTPPVDASSLASTYFEVYPAADGFLSRGGNRYDFNEDGTGAETFSSGMNEFSWELADGVIQLTYLDEAPSYYYPSVDASNVGLTGEQKQLLKDNNITQVEVMRVQQSSSMQRIIQGEKTDTYRFVSTGIDTMTPITVGQTLVNPAGVVYESNQDQLLRNADKLGDVKFTETELVGQWMFEHYYYVGEQGLGYANMFADIFEINADGTGTALEVDKSFSWEVDAAGAFVATFADGSSIKAIKLDQVGTDVQVFSATYDAEGSLIAADADYALMLDGSDFSTFDQTNPEDMYWNTTINTWTKDSWENGNLLWDEGNAYFGWQLLEDNTGYALGDTLTEPPTFEPLFNFPLTWEEEAVEGSEDESVVSINRWTCMDDGTKPCAQRQWRLLKSTQGNLGPRIYVFEIEERRNNSTSPWYVVNGIGPRLNIYEELSFSYWNDTAVEPAAVVTSGVSTTKASIGSKKAVARILVEPNQKPASGM
jgi:hypothetical protein